MAQLNNLIVDGLTNLNGRTNAVNLIAESFNINDGVLKLRGKNALEASSATDTWLRINNNSQFTSGTLVTGALWGQNFNTSSDAFYLTRGYISSTANASGGSNGWLNLLKITINSSYQNTPILMTIFRRGVAVTNIELRFVNSQTVANTTIAEFVYTGANCSAKLQATSTGVYDLWVRKTESYDNIAIAVQTNAVHMSGVQFTYQDVFSSTEPEGTAATLRLLTVAEGGTGAATAAGACGNIGAVKKTGDTMSGTLILSGITTSSWTEGIRINDSAGGWTALVLGDTLTSGKSTKTWSLHTYQGAFYLTHNGSSTSTDNTGILSCTAAGRWTLANGLNIGYTNESYALSVNSFICQTWVRTVGATGWYNETYGGGWYMTDSTYIRNYGGREVYLNAQLGVDANIKLWASNRQIQRVSRDVLWISGRDSAILRETDSTGWHAIISCKTAAGSWDIGEYNNGSTFNDKLVFSWASDTNYSAGINSTMTAIRFTKEGYIEAKRVYNAVWNDYAEYRSQKEYIEPGRVVIEQDNGKLIKSTERLQKGGSIVSDTFGTAMGETDNAKTPIAVSGRVLAYTDAPRETFHAGDCVCTGPNGTVSKMTDEEEEKYPLRCIGIVSEIPDYETWGSEDNTVKVNGRIWIKVK